MRQKSFCNILIRIQWFMAVICIIYLNKQELTVQKAFICSNTRTQWFWNRLNNIKQHNYDREKTWYTTAISCIPEKLPRFTQLFEFAHESVNMFNVLIVVSRIVAKLFIKELTGNSATNQSLSPTTTKMPIKVWNK